MAIVAAVAVALLAAEVVLRQSAALHPLGALYYRDAEGREATPADALARGLIVPVEAAENQRGRLRFADNANFFLCYRGMTPTKAPWLDDQGCVAVQTNAFGLRERAEISPDGKAPGEARIVCVGDSLTFGWGVPVEACWVRGLEVALRAEGKDVRTVNCGAAGAMVADEYWRAFERRFQTFAPDGLIVTLSLNDLLPSSGLCLIPAPRYPTGIRLWDGLVTAFGPDPLDLAPGIDWVEVLMTAPRHTVESAGLCNPDGPWDAMWAQGAPQAALRAFRAWSLANDCPLLVVLWPFLQGTGPGRHYPFTRMHELVADFCRTHDIRFVDLLPAMVSIPAEELWVTPLDLHPNARGHAIATRHLLPSVRELLAR